MSKLINTWRQHFVITHYPEMWEVLKGWICLKEEDEFEACWQKILSLAPDSVIEYLKAYWLPVKPWWSAVYLKNPMVFKEGNTNMLVEVYMIL